jgi:DNA-3-methyladenine glycosylase II
LRLTLDPLPPFDFDLSARIFSDGDPRIRKYQSGKYWQVIRLNRKLVLITIVSTGSMEGPLLIVDLRANDKISNNDKKKAEEIISSLFNIAFDLKLFYEGVKEDKVLSELTQKLKGLKNPRTSTIFEALMCSIIEQQISLNVAHTLQVNMIKTFGDTLKIRNEFYHAFPTPQGLAIATREQLRKCGLSLKKAEYINDISQSIVDGELNLDKYENYKDAKSIINELCKIRGIGGWTAELTMIRGMNRLDVIPADDLGLRRHISHYYCNDRNISSAEARSIAESWGRWKGLAGYYLIVAARLGIEI